MAFKRSRNAKGRSRPFRRSSRRRTGVVSSLVRSARRRYRKKAGFRFYKQVQSRSNLIFVKDVAEYGTISPPVTGTSNPVYSIYNFDLTGVRTSNPTIKTVSDSYMYYKCYKAVLEIRPMFWTQTQGSPYYRVMMVPNQLYNAGPVAGSNQFERWPTVAGYREASGPRRLVYVWRPRPTEEVAQSTASASDVNAISRRQPWISTVSPNTVLYGPLVACRVDNNIFPEQFFQAYRVLLRTYWMFKRFDSFEPEP